MYDSLGRFGVLEERLRDAEGERAALRKEVVALRMAVQVLLDGFDEEHRRSFYEALYPEEVRSGPLVP